MTSSVFLELDDGITEVEALEEVVIAVKGARITGGGGESNMVRIELNLLLAFLVNCDDWIVVVVVEGTEGGNEIDLDLDKKGDGISSTSDSGGRVVATTTEEVAPLEDEEEDLWKVEVEVEVVDVVVGLVDTVAEVEAETLLVKVLGFETGESSNSDRKSLTEIEGWVTFEI